MTNWGPLEVGGPEFIEPLEPRIATPLANNESSEVFDIIKPGGRVKIKGYRQ